MAEFLNPTLTDSTEAFIRAAYGVLLVMTLTLVLPDSKRFFVSERWGGYAVSSPFVDRIQNPRVLPVVMAIWLTCGVLIAVGLWSVWASLINLILCRYFFIAMRWRGVLRGMGAPGFMTYWLGAGVFLLEYARVYGTPELSSLALLVLQVDFALIILSAGIYKSTAGYPRNFGMELGLVNPEWGYWWRWYRRQPTSHWSFWTMNQLAWSTEMVAAVLMLLPATRFIGGLLIVLSFLFVATQIRLSLLCEMVVLCGLLYFVPDSVGSHWLNAFFPLAASQHATAESVLVTLFNTILGIGLWAYLVLLPLAHAGLFFNFYAHRSLPAPLQQALERYTNFFGIIIWRVFSVDHLNFFIQIYAEGRRSGERTLISRYGFGGTRRYNQVAESITVTTLFTTLKYFPSKSGLFAERLLRYARTVPCPDGSVLVFEYVSILKRNGAFAFVPVAEYAVDVARGTVEEHVLDKAVSVRAAHAVSPVHEGARPGSYAPLAS